MEPLRVPPEPSPRRARLGAVAIGLGVACLAWGALHMADASLQGSGDSFESRQTYDEVKRRSRQAFLGTLARAGAGVLLIGAGARLRRPGRPGGRGPGAA